MNFFDFLKLIKDDESWAISFLIDQQILFIPICSKCGLETTPVPRNIKIYACNRSFNGVSCKYETSIFTQSLFHDKKISLFDTFYIIDAWRRSTVAEIIALDLNVSSTTICNWYKKLNELVVWRKRFLGDTPIGGENIIVELDECLAVKESSTEGGC